MKLATKKSYLNYKVEQLKKIISNNGEFVKEEFEKITNNIINVGKKELLDYCEQIGIITYKGKVYISADDYSACKIIYNNIKATIYTKEEFKTKIAQNVIVVKGNNNNLNNIERNNDSKNDDDVLFSLVLSKLELMQKEGVSKKEVEQLKTACNNKNKETVIKMLKDIATGVISSLIAAGILYKFGIY